MFNIGTGELVVIALIALIVLGPDKLPQAARQVGQFTSEARKIANGFRQEMKSAMDEVADTTAAPAGSSGSRLSEAPSGAQPIDAHPVEAKPLTPPSGEGRPGPVRPDDPSAN